MNYNKPKFPAPDLTVNGRHLWRLRTIRQFELACVAYTTGTRPTPLPAQLDDDQMVDTRRLAERFGRHRRTIARWIRGDHPALEPEAA
jgi:hypothetical protein